MSFIATGASQESGLTVKNLAFYPDLNLDNFRALYRIDTTVKNEVAIDALINAMVATNAELKAWRAEQEAAGHAALADVPADSYDGTSEKITHYLTAVYSRAKALLVERFRDFDSTGAGHGRADDLNLTTGDYLQQTRESLRALKGLPRTIVELI
ncbi:head completion/stabilization protein [Sedimenticola hydrogenitrophicus]|uniref:head completion/stabilization protein n=1 Tax=Sedimenticola hydrogenitrophicus TaxID=2967975 RepID=UPI0023B0BE3B|nr:head completion/stabilization protein [Sedimenticola hydrogenitrophicus]